jgi:nitrate/TMAO reductase-like tetraheme cytochrome c subunit
MGYMAFSKVLIFTSLFFLLSLLLLPQSVCYAEDDLLLGGDLMEEGTPDSKTDDEGDLLGGDLLGEEPSKLDESDSEEKAVEETQREIADRAHTELLSDGKYPSAAECAACHQSHYDEWSVSPHAYAQLSPVFNAMHAKIVKETNGTQGDFCIRCHTPVGMQMGEPELENISKRAPVSQEGVTCIACHRVDREYGKISGRFPIIKGDIYEPVFGPDGNKELKRVLNEKQTYKVVTSREESGRAIHTDAVRFEKISESGFCGTCHDVTFVNGFRLEEAFSEYKGSPAAKRGESCQDCHMGKVPGIASGYRQEPAAVIGGEPTAVRKRTNHMMVGPDYSIVHPGIFPHNPDAKELATMDEWTRFNHHAGWGTPSFESGVTEDQEFPDRWSTVEDRVEARAIVDKQMVLLEKSRTQRIAILKKGYRMDAPVLTRVGDSGIAFEVKVFNGTDGHNVPTGFIGERLVFIRALLKDASGEVLFASGDLDPNGDVRDSHSVFVHNGERELDTQLFSLQSNFIVRANRGGDREQVIPLNYSTDPLIYNRPSTFSSILRGRPGGARIHRKGIEPRGERWVRYNVDPKLLNGNEPYRLEVSLIAGMVPVNLIDAIKDVGFDFNLSPAEVARRVVAGHEVLWDYSMPIEMKKQTMVKN